MNLRAIGTRITIRCAPTATALEVARLMEERNVGCVVVVADDRPVGIVTDRDLVLRVLRVSKDPATVPVAQVMTTPVHAVREDATPIEAAATMRARKVRRLPIVDAEGRLAAIVTFDDIVHHVGRTNAELSDVVESFPFPHAGG